MLTHEQCRAIYAAVCKRIDDQYPGEDTKLRRTIESAAAEAAIMVLQEYENITGMQTDQAETSD